MGAEDKGRVAGAQEKNRDRQGSMEPQVGGRLAEARESSLQDRGEAERSAGMPPERERQYGRMAEGAVIAARQLAQRSKASSQRKRCKKLLMDRRSICTSQAKRKQILQHVSLDFAGWEYTALLCRVKCFYAGVRWALVLPTEAVLTRQALAAALTAALGQVGGLSSRQTCALCISITFF